MALLSHRREVASDLPEDYSAFICPKAAGNFLANLHHSDVSLSKVVIIGDGEIVQERQYFFAPFQPFDEVAPFGLCGFSPFS